jgi:hypothetical protein
MAEQFCLKRKADAEPGIAEKAGSLFIELVI